MCGLAEHIFQYSTAVRIVQPRRAFSGSAVKDALGTIIVQSAESLLSFSVILNLLSHVAS